MKYLRLVSRLYNTPLALEQSKLDIITSNITLKILSGENVEKLSTEINDESYKQYLLYRKQQLDNIDVIKIFDSLAAKNAVGDSGVTTYENIQQQVEFAVLNGKKELFFYIDSPGGEVNGLIALSNYLYSLPLKYGVKTIGFTDGLATSAAYTIAASLQKVYATDSSILGSIATIMSLIDMTEKDKKDGIKYEILRSKSDKALLNPHEGFSSKMKEKAMELLMKTDTILNNSIISKRKIVSLDTILNLNGDTIFAEDALKLNLIDGIVSSLDEVKSLSKDKKLYIKKQEGVMMEGVVQSYDDLILENKELKEKLSANQSDLLNLKSQVEKVKAEEKERILSILSANKKFGLSAETAIKFIENNASTEMAVSTMELIKENIQSQTGIDITSSSVVSTLNEQTIVKENLSAKDILLRTMQSLQNPEGVK